ncbi:hypothetical protein EC9_15220 [Rosistilla ulvae]|uniref:Major Facilitator Superfamily protein n=1 Tax=Rosistilla ulvae TaxID=1930277 RepID=A0A517LXI6_9BACT|nr:DUF5690 family protein [Rosistilla ulvae]QDS87344.1 hypothetical protein EC9_15220 [Rosistilla ulvae]
MDTPSRSNPTVWQSAAAWSPMLWGSMAAFGTYFCMYAFRKPFTVIDYDDLTAWGWGYKTVAVAAQVFGYMVSKFLGIKVLSELPTNRRAISIIGLILFAELALIGFGLVPAPYNLICLVLNGLPLGMVFGLVLGFLEGRKQTEALAAILCTSFILSDGVTKSVGKGLLDMGVPGFWMPASAGALFLLPLFGFVWMLRQIPPPSEADIEARSERTPLTSQERRAFFSRYAWGLTPLLVMYLLVTIVRSVRSDFAPQLWESLGVATTPELFSYSELWVGLGVTLANGAAMLVSDNYRGFKLALATCSIGFAILLMSTYGQHVGLISPFLFMVLIGVGLYLPYVATHTTIFERLIAMTRDRGNLVHLMYLADSIGYLGYVGVMLTKNAFQPGGDFMAFFRPTCYAVGLVSLLCMIGCQCYFSLRASRQTLAPPPIPIEQPAT